MPYKKQQKLNDFARKSTANDDEERTPPLEPMEDADVHAKSQSSAINTLSANTDSTAKQDDTDDLTVPIDNTPDLSYSRCDVKLSIHGTTNNNYIDALQQIQSLFTKLKKEDQHLTFAPWSDDSIQQDLQQPTDIPSDENDAEDYFRGLNPRDDKTGKQILWFKAQIGHVIDLDDSLHNIQRFYLLRNGRLHLFDFK